MAGAIHATLCHTITCHILQFGHVIAEKSIILSLKNGRIKVYFSLHNIEYYILLPVQIVIFRKWHNCQKVRFNPFRTTFRIFPYFIFIYKIYYLFYLCSFIYLLDFIKIIRIYRVIKKLHQIEFKILICHNFFKRSKKWYGTRCRHIDCKLPSSFSLVSWPDISIMYTYFRPFNIKHGWILLRLENRLLSRLALS